MTHFATAGLGATLLPRRPVGKDAGSGRGAYQRRDAFRDALAMSGIEFSEEERTEMVERVNDAIEKLRRPAQLPHPE